MMRALYSGVTGLRNHQTRMDVISNNIANVNTVGFKASRALFKDVFSQTTSTGGGATAGITGGTNPQQIGLGVQISTIDILHTRSATQNTGNTLDLMIDGDGFFSVKNTSGQTMFTRAGNFYIDTLNQLVTGEGFFVQGYMYSPVNQPLVQPVMSDEIRVDLNDDGSSQSAPFRQIAFDDSETALQGFDKDGNLVDVTIIVRDGGIKLDATGKPVLEAARDANKNLLKDANGNEIMVPVYVGDPVKQWADHANNGVGGLEPVRQPVYVTDEKELAISYENVLDSAGNTIPIQCRNEDGSLMYDRTPPTGFSMITINPDLYTNVSIDKNGVVSGMDKATGEILQIAQIEIATFSNSQALEKVGGNYYLQTSNSGDPVYSIPGNDGSGVLNPGSLEMSNVDLSAEFTDMIVTQRGFQANSRIITTSDSMLEELVNLKR